jgi:hypothetical protein
MSSRVGKSRVTGSDSFILVGVGNTVIVASMSAVQESLDEQLHLDVLSASVRALLDLP